MNYRKFGKTDLEVSEVGFGAWAIGGPAMAGDIPLGWGDVDDSTSVDALKKAFDLGINFYDTADFYGLGHSETLLGNLFGNSREVIIASKVGHRLDEQQNIYHDYSKKWILEACENSLRRLKRDSIDFYQLHTARMKHLETGECQEAMELLKEQGKIRYWGLSLNTFAPQPEADFLLKNNLGSGFQLVLNIVNQSALPILESAGRQGFGIIARMPLQFGLLTGKFDKESRFAKDDHRSLRLKPEYLQPALDNLQPVWAMAESYGIHPASLALGFVLSHPQVSTVIPGIKNPGQAIANTKDIVQLKENHLNELHRMYDQHFAELLKLSW